MSVSTSKKAETGLPGDLESCHALIRDLAFLLESKDADILCLRERLQNLLRQKFGRNSEKLTPGQLSLFRQELEDLLQESGAAGESPEHVRPPEQSGRRNRTNLGDKIGAIWADYRSISD